MYLKDLENYLKGVDLVLQGEAPQENTWSVIYNMITSQMPNNLGSKERSFRMFVQGLNDSKGQYPLTASQWLSIREKLEELLNNSLRSEKAEDLNSFMGAYAEAMTASMGVTGTNTGRNRDVADLNTSGYGFTRQYFTDDREGVMVRPAPSEHVRFGINIPNVPVNIRFGPTPPAGAIVLDDTEASPVGQVMASVASA